MSTDKHKRKASKKSGAKKKTSAKKSSGTTTDATTVSLGNVLRGRVADAKTLRTVYLKSGLRYQRTEVVASANAPAPRPLPDTFPCRAGQTLKIQYGLEVVVAELDLKWLPDVDGNGEWDGEHELGHTEVSSQVDGLIENIPARWSLLQWTFTPANLEPWRALLTINVDGVLHVFEELSGDESATHHGHLLIEAVPHA